MTMLPHSSATMHTVLTTTTEAPAAALTVSAHKRWVNFRARSLVGYGEDQRIPNLSGPLLAVKAMDLTRGDFFPPNWSGGQVVAETSRNSEEITAVGRDGDLIWARRDTFVATAEPTERTPIYTMLWGGVDSPLMFTLSADTPEHRDALLGAFISAARRRGAGARSIRQLMKCVDSLRVRQPVSSSA